MPDLDIIDRKVARGWQPPFKLFVGRGTPTEIARALSQALARSLRENGGLPGFDRWIDLLQKRTAGELDSHSAFVRAEAIERELQHDRHTKVAAWAMRKTLVTLGHPRSRRAHVGRAFSEDFLRCLVDHHFFGRIRPDVVGQKRLERLGDVETREGRCRDALEPFILRLADSLIREPAATSLRSPAIRVSTSRTTEDLLHQPIM